MAGLPGILEAPGKEPWELVARLSVAPGAEMGFVGVEAWPSPGRVTAEPATGFQGLPAAGA